eukprot:scaffold25595_cov60-Phaeocystis_antarctica.AAC.2
MAQIPCIERRILVGGAAKICYRCPCNNNLVTRGGLRKRNVGRVAKNAVDGRGGRGGRSRREAGEVGKAARVLALYRR